MDAEKEKQRLEELSKDLYTREKEFENRIKEFEDDKEKLNNIKKSYNKNKKELNQLTADYKAKNKLLKDVQSKIDELGGAAAMAQEIEALK